MKSSLLPTAGSPAKLLTGLVLAPAAVQAQESPPETFPETLESQWTNVTEWLVWFWDLQVFRIGDVAVLVSQVVFALILLIAGSWLARQISRSVRNRLTSRTSLDASAVAAIEKMLFYLLLVVVILMALQAMHIPIAIFTFFGGAIAIGVGFGAQAIFSNFISGLILMLDRPIRLGDTVEVAEHYGRIAEIGSRCTRLRRFDGVDVLVPNSTLIENSVVNWTLADKQIRQMVRVGIAYGSDLRRVSDLLLQAANERSDILKGDNVNAQVIFEDFGDNALIFELYFWLELSDLINMRIIRSDIRFRIDELFREAGISIAFPQRDLHLNTPKPLEIRMVTSDSSTAVQA